MKSLIDNPPTNPCNLIILDSLGKDAYIFNYDGKNYNDTYDCLWKLDDIKSRLLGEYWIELPDDFKMYWERK